MRDKVLLSLKLRGWSCRKDRQRWEQVEVHIRMRWQEVNEFSILIQGLSFGVCLLVCLVVFVFLGPYLWHMEVPRLGVESEL